MFKYTKMKMVIISDNWKG